MNCWASQFRVHQTACTPVGTWFSLTSSFTVAALERLTYRGASRSPCAKVPAHGGPPGKGQRLQLFNLSGRTALVTGAGHGLGRQFALTLAQAGASIVATDISEEGLAVTAERAVTGPFRTHRMDVTDEESIRSVFNAVGHVDILVNNAAVYNVVKVDRGNFATLEVDAWRQMLAVNVIGTWLCCKVFVPPMQSARYGKVVNISSGTALKGSPEMVHYAASKAAVIGLTKSLARAVGRDGVTVNALAPGNTLSEDVISDEMRASGERTAATRAIPRQQMPQDLLGSLLFLASPASDFMTGQTVVVDGGSYLH